jgi:hypothetical protein
MNHRDENGQRSQSIHASIQSQNKSSSANQDSKVDSVAQSNLLKSRKVSNLESSFKSTDLRYINPDEQHHIQINVLSSKSKKNPCSICQVPLFVDPNDDVSVAASKFDKYEKVEYLVMTPCKHVFHEDCFKATFKSKPQCPLCRADLIDMRNDQFIYEESEHNDSIYLVIDFGPVQYQVSFGAADELLHFIQSNSVLPPRDERPENASEQQNEQSEPLIDQNSQPIETQPRSEVISDSESASGSVGSGEQRPLDPDISNNEGQSQQISHTISELPDVDVMIMAPRTFLHTPEGELEVFLNPNALHELLNERQEQDPEGVNENQQIPDLTRALNMLSFRPGGFNELFRSRLQEAQPVDDAHLSQDYSLQMNSELGPMHEVSALIHQRNYSLG